MRLAVGIIAGIILIAVCVWSWKLSNADDPEQEKATEEGGRP